MATFMPSAALYVGDLEHNVDERQLYFLFSQVVQVVSVKVCRDRLTGLSLGYGYVNFLSHQLAAIAMNILNYYPLNGKPIRIMFSNRDPLTRRSGYANVYINNLHKSIHSKALHHIFSRFGNILSSKVAADEKSGESKGYGFVQFEKHEAAQSAIKFFNGKLMNGKQVYVGPIVPRHKRIPSDNTGTNY